MTMTGLALVSVLAAANLTIDENRSISVGIGLRTSVSTTARGAPDGESRTYDSAVEAGVLGIGGKVDKRLRFQLNFARTPLGETRSVDAFGMLELHESANVWAGRFLPPGDRASLSGPFFQSTWEPPFVASLYPTVAAGRDDGVAAWGQWRGGKAKVYAGGFRGRDGVGPTTTNTADRPLLIGRVVVNLLDPEPGYYNAGTYHGAKDVLAIGGGVRRQELATGTGLVAGDAGTYTGWNVDALLEKRLGPAGTGTIEYAFYRYDLGDALDPAIAEGDGWFVTGGWLLPVDVRGVRFQPTVRVQRFDATAGPARERIDACLNVLWQGHFTRFGVNYSEDDAGPAARSVRTVKLGAQFLL